MANVYISSTFQDLRPFREAAAHALEELRHSVRAMESYVAADDRPLDRCVADVDWCDFYVGIFAWRYGFVPAQGNPQACSITELEYRRAAERGKSCLIFLLDDKTPWDRAFDDAVAEDGDRGRHIKALREGLKARHTCSFFSTPEELARKVTASITVALESRTQAAIEDERRERDGESQRQVRGEGRRVVGLRVLDAGSMFRDRVEYRRELSRLLAEPSTRMVNIVGRPGIGKTALAAAVLGEIEQGRWPHAEQALPVDGIVYMSARAGTISLESLYDHCALMLGGERERELRQVWRHERLTVEEKVERLLQALEGRLHVILLDHIDSLLDNEANLVDPELRVLLDRALLAQRGTRLVVTSREPLALSSQTRAFHRHVVIEDGLPVAEGVALLRDLDPDGILGLRDSPEEQLARVVQRLHGVPRALELLVALVQKQILTPLDEILEGFYRSPDVLNELVRAAFQRLDPDERLLVDILAVLEQPSKKHAAEFMMRPFRPGLAVDRVLSNLVQSRMIRFDRATGLLSLNDIDREYALSELATDGPGGRQALERSAAAYHASLTVPRERLRCLLDAEPQLSQILHLIRAGDYDNAVGVLAEIDLEAVLWMGAPGRIADLLSQLDGKIEDAQRQAQYFFARGLESTLRGLLPEAMQLLDRADQLARSVEAVELRRLTEGWRGEVCRRLDRLDEAVTHLTSATDIYREGTVPPRDNFALALSLVYSYQRRARSALWWAERLRTLITDTPIEARFIGQVNDALALASLVARRFAEAAEHARRSIDYYRTTAAQEPAGYVLNVLGMALLALERHEEAVVHFMEGMQAGRDVSSPRLEGFSAFNLARAQRLLNRQPQASDMATAAEGLLGRVQAPEAAAARALSRALRAAQEKDSAAECRALLDCARASARTPDLVAPLDILTEAATRAEAAGLPELVAAAKSLATEIDAASES